MKLRTGLLDMDTTVPEIVKQLTVCFLALFNRQCISKAFIYMYHNGPEYDDEDDVEAEAEAAAFNDALIRALKYNTLSPNGIGAKLKPSLALAHSKGYLEPEDYEDNKYATRAVLVIFPILCNAWQRGGELAARAWVLEYSMEMFADAQTVANEALWAEDIDEDEMEGMIGDLSDESSSIVDYLDHDGEIAENETGEIRTGDEMEIDNQEEQVECDCDLCEEMRSYDNLNLENIQSSDPLDNLMINGLKKALLQVK